jgi:uncharacterized protein (TIGR02444 family)
MTGQPGRASPLWHFSVDFYARPDVAEACLQLQEACGADVNIVLFLLWRATARDALTADAVRRLDDSSRDWRENVVAPLRTLRRRLKAGCPPMAPNAAESFRSKVKAVELAAERLQQDAMSGMAGALETRPAGSVHEATRLNLAAYAELLGRKFPPGSLDVLASALCSPA